TKNTKRGKIKLKSRVGRRLACRVPHLGEHFEQEGAAFFGYASRGDARRGRRDAHPTQNPSSWCKISACRNTPECSSITPATANTTTRFRLRSKTRCGSARDCACHFALARSLRS